MNQKYSYNKATMFASIVSRVNDSVLALFVFDKRAEIEEMADMYLDHLFGDDLFMMMSSPYMVKLKALLQSFCDAHPELKLTPGNEFFIPFNTELAGEFTAIYCKYIAGKDV